MHFYTSYGYFANSDSRINQFLGKYGTVQIQAAFGTVHSHTMFEAYFSSENCISCCCAIVCSTSRICPGSHSFAELSRSLSLFALTMQPPASVEDDNVSDTSDNFIASKSEDNRDFVENKNAVYKCKEIDAEKANPLLVAKPTVHLSARSPGPYRGKCLYQSRKCENERAVKRNGKPHNLCDMHRNKQNRHQRKFDAKKFSRKRRRDSISEENVRDDEQARQEPSVWHHLPSKSYGVLPSMLSSTRRNYRPSTSSGPMIMTLPSIQNLRGPVLPASPSLSYSTSDSLDDNVAPSQFRAVDAPIVRNRQQPRRLHREPYQQYQVQQTSPEYLRSECGAASLMVDSYTLAASRAASSSTNYKTVVLRADEPRRQVWTTPHVLPSLVGPRLESPSIYRRVSETLPQRFALAKTTSASSVSMSRSTSAGNGLPYLRSLNLSRAPMSPSSFSRSR